MVSTRRSHGSCKRSIKSREKQDDGFVRGRRKFQKIRYRLICLIHIYRKHNSIRYCLKYIYLDYIHKYIIFHIRV